MISEALYSSRTEEWETPQDFFDALDSEFHFTLDAASTDENAKCKRHFTKEDDGLQKSWAGETVWLNPPYGKDIGKWMQKAYEESRNGATVVCLVHARTDTKWFHDWVYQKPNVDIRFVKGRLKFGGSQYNAPFPSMIVVYKAEEGENGTTD